MDILYLSIEIQAFVIILYYGPRVGSLDRIIAYFADFCKYNTDETSRVIVVRLLYVTTNYIISLISTYTFF